MTATYLIFLTFFMMFNALTTSDTFGSADDVDIFKKYVEGILHDNLGTDSTDYPVNRDGWVARKLEGYADKKPTIKLATFKTYMQHQVESGDMEYRKLVPNSRMTAGSFVFDSFFKVDPGDSQKQGLQRFMQQIKDLYDQGNFELLSMLIFGDAKPKDRWNSEELHLTEEGWLEYKKRENERRKAIEKIVKEILKMSNNRGPNGSESKEEMESVIFPE